MSDLFSIGSSALLSYRRALDTIGHNVANVDTAGYSRQRVELATSTPTTTGQGVFGNGVYAATVTRSASDLVQQRLVSGASQVGYFEVQSELAVRLDSLLSDTSLSVGTGLDDFFTAVEAVAADPTSTAARQSLLSAGEDFTRRIGTLSNQFDTIEGELAFEFESAVASANGLASQIANLNKEIALATGRSGGNPPNDLLDQRDELVRSLAGELDIRTVVSDTGELNVFSQSGQALVLGINAYELSVVDDPLGGGVPQLAIETQGGAVNISNQVGGGRLGGILASADVLATTRGQVAQLAIGVTEQFNALHASGVTPDGQPGGLVFTAASIDVLAHTGNSGSAELAVSVADPGDLPDGDPVLRFDGTQWLRVDGGETVALGGAGTTDDPLVIDGLSVVVSGTPAANDRFRLDLSGALSDVGMALSDPDGIAAAGAVVVEADTGNTGTIALAAVAAEQADDPNFGAAASIVFTAADQVSIDGAAPEAYDAQTGILVNGTRLTFTGTPAAGDRFDLTPTGAGSADNRAAQALSDLASSSWMRGGLDRPADAAARLVSTVGNTAAAAEAAYAGAQSIQSADLAERDAISGVNLDEEAANLMRFEQAYQAAAQVLSVASGLFDTLLSAVRR
ncbi:flagellar hook-associated protein FlgK [uncultured Abyssibacter sp.]|uniref:flagellar hook-associated protein FlgK n=1 Tax=uncultured Abyssibacter sp. TaxID=2320202 RepID=UPI0032B1B792